MNLAVHPDKNVGPRFIGEKLRETDRGNDSNRLVLMNIVNLFENHLYFTTTI